MEQELPLMTDKRSKKEVRITRVPPGRENLSRRADEVAGRSPW
jgi:hypothetical protein